MCSAKMGSFIVELGIPKSFLIYYYSISPRWVKLSMAFLWFLCEFREGIADYFLYLKLAKFDVFSHFFLYKVKHRFNN